MSNYSYKNGIVYVDFPLPDGTPGPKREFPLYAFLQYEDIKQLQGKILTVIDASISDKVQNKAIKDLIKQKIWWEWANNLEMEENGLVSGVPIED